MRKIPIALNIMNDRPLLGKKKKERKGEKQIGYIWHIIYRVSFMWRVCVYITKVVFILKKVVPT